MLHEVVSIYCCHALTYTVRAWETRGARFTETLYLYAAVKRRRRDVVEMANYRPMLNVTFLSNVVERGVVAKQLYWHLTLFQCLRFSSADVERLYCISYYYD